MGAGTQSSQSQKDKSVSSWQDQQVPADKSEMKEEWK